MFFYNHIMIVLLIVIAFCEASIFLLSITIAKRKTNVELTVESRR